MTVRETIDPNSSLWAWLAFDLWFHRTRRGLSLGQTALIVRVARGTVSNWEAGRHRPNEGHMKLLDGAWNTGGHFQRLMHYARTGHDPDWFKQYVQYEAAAEVIKIYNGKNVPLLVQTEEYAQAILKTDGSARMAEVLSKARMKRQSILEGRTKPYVWILIDQEVLECPVGSKQIMAGQLRHLLGTDDHPRLSVRVVLRSTGHHPGHDGPFQLLKVHGREIAYAGAQIGGRLIEAGDEAAELGIKFDQIGAFALSRDDSRGLIERTMGMYQ
ncbi:helix-turn-helix domain-containing protein [Actinomadura algeriensis]|uniref:Transcriptional regulator with XRE-family HTH domain n=1 Tax=Actinomadura algeriensis TaxID=1679523 RepID=A0ABR9JK85_9ACTN|nr:helix-turn-helix transcriptional regulator [Actinomadura algeriensis]MBE1530957.1 transcriptional regulator with XRE-family HTH domain [Actinomadura algeriensis]